MEYKMLIEAEDVVEDDEYEDIIIGKEGDYVVLDDGAIVIPKKPKGKKGGKKKPKKGKGGKPGEPGEPKKPGEPGGEGEDEDEGDFEPIPEGSGTNEIDEHNKKVEERIKGGKDLDSKEAEKAAKEQAGKEAADNLKGGGGSRGKGTNSQPSEIDYTKIEPKHNWQEVIKLFIGSAREESEESYQRPSRKSIQSMHTAAQTGAGAMKPGEVILDAKEIKLAFCIDSSGSMGGVIETVYANIAGLLQNNAKYKKTVFTLLKFSDSFGVWKGMWNPDKAIQVPSKDLLTVPKNYDDKMSTVFKRHYGSVTNFSSELTSDLQTLIKAKHNVIIFSDSDIASGENMNELVKVLKTSGGKSFVLFDNKDTWIQFRKNSGISTDFISYINKE